MAALSNIVFRHFAATKGGGVSVMGALSLPVVLGALSLSVELGNAYAVRVQNQAIADTAALAAAQVYSVNGSEAELRAAARDAVQAGGLAGSAVVAELTASPDGSGDQAVHATITTRQPYYFSRIFGLRSSFAIAADAYARLGTSVPPCIIALASDVSEGVSAVGGSKLTADECAVQGNDDIYASGGSSIKAMSITTHGSVRTPPYDSSVTTGPDPDKITEGAPRIGDPLADHAGIEAALDTLGTYTPVVVPTLSLATGSDFAPGYWPATYAHTNASGVTYSGSYNSATATWSFPAGTYDIRNLSVAGGQKIVFAGPVTLNISGSVKQTGAGLEIGAGAVNSVRIAGDVTVTGGSSLTIGDGPVSILGTLRNSSKVTIGAGRHHFGRLDIGAAFSVGAGDHDVNGTITLEGGMFARFGDGAFAVTRSAGKDDAIALGGAASIAFGDGPFSANGAITSSGSATTIFGATANHYINGSLTLGGNATFGAGIYYVNGDLINKTTGTMTGADVSFIVAGTLSLGGSAQLNLSAPSAKGSALEDLLLVTRSNGTTTIEAGASTVLKGIIYVPNTALSVHSGGKLSGGGGCWSLVAQTVAIKGGADAKTRSCSPLSGAGKGSANSITLVR